MSLETRESSEASVRALFEQAAEEWHALAKAYRESEGEERQQVEDALWEFENFGIAKIFAEAVFIREEGSSPSVLELFREIMPEALVGKKEVFGLDFAQRVANCSRHIYEKPQEVKIWQELRNDPDKRKKLCEQQAGVQAPVADIIKTVS